MAQNAESWDNTADADSSMLAYEEVVERDGVPMKEEAREVGTDGEEDMSNVDASEAMSGARSKKEERNPAGDLALSSPPSFLRSSC